MFKICIWTPTITHHQSDFHDAIVQDGRVNLAVRYFKEISKERLNLGWENKTCGKSYEKEVASLSDALKSLDEFSNHIHIISGNGYDFTKKLINYCVKNELKWINWTERNGGGLFELLGNNSGLFNFFFPIYRRLYNRKFSKLIESFAMGTFVSGIKAEEDYLIRGVSKEKIKHLYYAIKPLERATDVPNNLMNSKFKYHFIYTGSLAPRKGVDILLEAYSRLYQNEWGLILAGMDVSNGQYQRQAKQLNIQDKVIFTGSINFNRVNEYMSFADVFILPTRFDGWGVVLNEAASLGMPIISTDECGASYHLIEDGCNGFVIKANSTNNLFTAMNKYLENHHLIKIHGQKSLSIVKNFSPENNVSRLVKALKDWS
jgi:glycosyltransferase involved in cell wall biosynthesis